MDDPGERQQVYIDLSDLELSDDLSALESRSEAASHVYERFTPYADDGWVWLTHPADPGFSGWVFEERGGRRQLVGANLLCTRVPEPQAFLTAPPLHHVSPHRWDQLVHRPWTTVPGSKILRRPTSAPADE